MGIFDKISSTVKQGTSKIGYTLLLRKHQIHIKKLIIANFDFRELSKMCVYFNIGSPHPTTTNKRGETIAVKPTYHHWADHALNNIELAKLRDYAENHHKLSYEIIQLERNYKQERIDKYPDYEKQDTSAFNSNSLTQDDDLLVKELIKAIEEFRPIKHFDNEEGYHTNLFTYLREKIPAEVGFEKQRGRSRPDIEVGDIAIEVKGPTDNQGLQTIADKMLRYPQHYRYIILVLFDVHVYEPRYQEWYEGMMRNHEGQVTIIRNDSASMEEPTPMPNDNAGHCIRCGVRISFNPDKPLCQNCYPSWARYSNYNFPEMYCHICGKMSTQSYSKPICYNCWKNRFKTVNH